MDDYDFSRIHAVKEAAQARLLAIPGVHAVGIGPKWVDGKPTTEPSIGVVLVRKRPLAEIPPDEVIPPVIDGVKTDIIEMDDGGDQAIGDDDGDTDRDRPFAGGVKITNVTGSGGWGTLGFIAHTNDVPPKIVGVTCEHVVISRNPADPSGLFVAVPAGSPNPYAFTFSGGTAPGSLVVIEITGTAPPAKTIAYHLTRDTEHLLSDVATAVAGAVNGIAGLGATATPANATVSIQCPPNTRVTDISIYAATALDPLAQLRAAITMTAGSSTIALSGSAAGNHAIYTSWNTSGATASGGTLTVVPQGTALGAIAGLVAGSVNAVATGGVHATGAANGTVVINGVDQAACEIRGELRIGQPTNSFGSTCSACCNDRIGRVIDSRREIDAALLRLDGGTYLAEIKEYGPVRGTHAITDPEAHTPGTYAVKKRGAMTGRRDGTIRLLSMDGTTFATGNNTVAFSRFYRGAMLIGPVGPPFSEGGDSGSAVLNSANEIVGLLFGGGSGFGRATPIDAITTAFHLTVETATAAHDVRTAPEWTDTLSFSAMPAVPARLAEMEREISAAPAGARVTELVRRHFAEAQRLVNANRRVAAVWHRNGGPKLLQGVLDLARGPDAALPREIDGMPLGVCLARIQAIFERYASPAFAADLRRYGAHVAALAGLTYAQIVAALHTRAVE